MKTTARFILSAATGLGLTAFTFLSAFTAGFNGATTVIAFSLLAIYGLLEIAMLSYAAPRFVPFSASKRNEYNNEGRLVRITPFAAPRNDAGMQRAA